MGCQSEVSQKAGRWNTPVGAAFKGPRDWTPRPNHRIEQTARGDSIAEFEPVGNQAGYTEVMRQGPHHVVEALADEHYVLRALFRHTGAQTLYPFRLQLLLKDVFEIFLAQRIQAVP